MAQTPEQVASPRVETPLPSKLPDLSGASHLYANGFGIGVTNSDAQIHLQLDGTVVTVLHLSYTLLKSVHEIVGTVVADLEKRIGHPIPSTKEMDASLKGDK